MVTDFTYTSKHSLNAANNTPHGAALHIPSQRVYIANNSDDYAYQYDPSVAYQTRSELPTGFTQPRGLCWVSSRNQMWGVDTVQNRIYKMNDTLASVGTIQLPTATYEGILYFESINEVWALARSPNKVYRIDATTEAVLGNFDMDAAIGDPYGGSYVFGADEAYILDVGNNRLGRLDKNGTYQGNYPLDAAHTNPRSCVSVGTSFWVLDNGTDEAFVYTLTFENTISLHNALFFKECRNYLNDGVSVTEYGNPANVLRVVADNNYGTSSRVTDYAIGIADAKGQPTRVDAVFLKCKGVTRCRGIATGGSGIGWIDVGLPQTVKNWEGTDVSTTVDGFQNYLFLITPHFTATSVRLQLEGSGIELYEVMMLEFGLQIDANGDLTEIDLDHVDRDGSVDLSGKSAVYQKPIGSTREKQEIGYRVRVRPGKTALQTPREFTRWRAQNRNHVHFIEPTRYPEAGFPAVFPDARVPVRYKTDDKTGTQLIQFSVIEA